MRGKERRGGKKKTEKRGLWVNIYTLYIIQKARGSSTLIQVTNTLQFNFGIFLNGIPCLPISEPQHLLQGTKFMLNTEKRREKGRFFEKYNEREN